MPNMTAEISQLAHTIAQLRKDRAIATTRRAEEVVVRSKVVASQLSDAQSARATQAREYQTAAASTNSRRSKEISSFLAANRHNRMTQHRHRLGEAAAQRRQLATFMSDLTDNVGAMRDGFRADLERDAKSQGSELAAFVTNLSTDVGTMRAGFRSQLNAMSLSLHGDLAEATRDRHAATDIWRGVKAKPGTHAAADRSQTHQTAVAVAGAHVPAKTPEPVVKATPQTPEPPAMGTPSTSTPPQHMTGHHTPAGSSPASQPAAMSGSHGSSNATHTPRGGKPS